MTKAGEKTTWVAEFPGWLRRKAVPLGGLVLVIAITFVIFYYFGRHPGRIEELAAYGYLGAFIIAIIFNATLILPAGGILTLMALGVALPSPVIVGLVGGLGAAIGEIIGFVAGRSGRSLVARSHMYTRVEGWLLRWGWLTIMTLSAAPLFFDLVGIAAGALRYPFWKFFVFCWLGRTILYVTVITITAWGLQIWAPWFG